MAIAQLIWGGYTSDGVVTIIIDGKWYEYRVDAALIPKMEYRFLKGPSRALEVLNKLKATCLWWVGPDGTFHDKESQNEESV